VGLSPDGSSKRDERRSEMNEGAVVQGFAFPADAKRAEVVVPAVRPLDNPSTRPTADTADQRLLAAAANVWNDATCSGFVLRIGVVVPLVEAQVHRPAGTSRCTDEDGVERGAHHPFVVHVRSRQGDGERNASAVCQNVAFAAEFCAIGRIRAGELPPLGAFTVALSREVHTQSIPRC
jgi:hypothetical protein